MPLGQVLAAAGEQPEPVTEPAEQRLRREQPGPGGGQLDGQGQPVEECAHLRHCGRVGLGQLEPPPGHSGAGHEQLDRLGLPQGLEGVLVLVLQGEQQPAGDQHPQPRAGPEQPGDRAPAVQDLLEVVEDHQHALVADVPGKRLTRRLQPLERDPEHPGDLGEDAIAVPDQGQVHEERAGREVVDRCCRHGTGEPGLPDPRPDRSP